MQREQSFLRQLIFERQFVGLCDQGPACFHTSPARCQNRSVPSMWGKDIKKSHWLRCHSLRCHWLCCHWLRCHSAINDNSWTIVSQFYFLLQILCLPGNKLNLRFPFAFHQELVFHITITWYRSKNNLRFKFLISDAVVP